MQAVLLAFHLIITVAMVALILMQRSEGGALGIGGGPGGLMTARGAGDFLTKWTKWLATAFIINLLAMGWLAQNEARQDTAIDAAVEQSQSESELPDLPIIPEGDDG